MEGLRFRHGPRGGLSEKGGRGSIDPLGGWGPTVLIVAGTLLTLLGVFFWGWVVQNTGPKSSPPTRFCLAYHVGNSCGIGRRPGMVVVLAVPGSASDQNQVIRGRYGFAVTRG